MNEFLRAFKDFLTRDFAYVVGGGSVIASLLWAFKPSDFPALREIPTEIFLFAAGLSYVVGYLMQEALSFTRLITTARILDLRFKCVLVKLYARFTGEKWEVRGTRDGLQNGHENLSKNDRLWAEYQRTVAFKNVAATVTANGFVCGVILAIKFLLTCAAPEAALAVMSFVLALVAWPMNWIKAGQQSTMLWRYDDPEIAARIKPRESGAADKEAAPHSPE